MPVMRRPTHVLAAGLWIRKCTHVPIKSPHKLYLCFRICLNCHHNLQDKTSTNGLLRLHLMGSDSRRPVTLQRAVGCSCVAVSDCRGIIRQERRATLPPAGQLDVLQVLLDVPQCVGTGLQLGHLVSGQSHVDHAGHTSAVQHAGQTQKHLVVDPIHALCTTHRKKIRRNVNSWPYILKGWSHKEPNIVTWMQKLQTKSQYYLIFSSHSSSNVTPSE